MLAATVWLCFGEEEGWVVEREGEEGKKKGHDESPLLVRPALLAEGI